MKGEVCRIPWGTGDSGRVTEMFLTFRREKIYVPGRRILAVSDIHGHGHYLKKLLEKAAFSAEDELVMIGDMIEKGPHSLETLRYVMELEMRPNVHVTAGNVDMRQWDLIGSGEISKSETLLQHIRTAKKAWGGSLFLDFCEEMGIDEPKTLAEVVEAKEKAAVYFKRELDFIGTRPSVIEAGNYIFVHGGLPGRWEELEGKSAAPVLKFDDFLNHCGTFDRSPFKKYAVVGHWPVYLYGKGKIQHNPLVDTDRRVISIDGGCGLRYDGQLNCLIIPEMCAPAEQISWESWDSFPEVTVLEEQEERESSIFIRYTDSKVELQSSEQPSSTAGEEGAAWKDKMKPVAIRHLSTGRILEVPEDFLYEENGILKCDGFCDYRIPLKSGERVALVEKNALGYQIKRNGVSAWYGGKILEDGE